MKTLKTQQLGQYLVSVNSLIERGVEYLSWGIQNSNTGKTEAFISPTVYERRNTSVDYMIDLAIRYIKVNF